MVDAPATDPSAVVVEDPAKTAGRRLTDAEFAQACELYELGTGGLTDLAEKFGISRQALSRRFKDNGIVRASKAAAAAAATVAAASAASTPAAVLKERYAEKRAEWIEETKMQGYQLLRQARMVSAKIVADAVKAGAKLESVDGELKALGRHNKILIDNIAASVSLLGAEDFTDEQDLPTLSVHDLTDSDILEHFVAIGALPENATLADLLDENIDDGDDDDEEAAE